MILQEGGGNVGIGTTTPTYRLQLPNIANASGQGQANAWPTYSSIRWKENITPMANALEKISLLNPVYFDWKAENGGIHSLGFIAEEVGKIVPEVVNWEDDGVYAKGMDYSKLTSLLTKGIQEQQGQISSLTDQLGELSLNDTGEITLDTSAATYSGVLDQNWMGETAENLTVTLNSTGETLTKVIASADGVFARIKTGFLQTTNLLAENILTKRLKVEEKIISPVVETAEIRPIANESGFGTLLIDGDAEFSGNVGIGEDLVVSGDATVSGELVVNELVAESARIRKLKAESIEGLEALIATITTQKIQTENISGLEATPSADLDDLTATDSAWLAELAETWETTTPSEDIKIEENITILGMTSLAQTVVSGSISQDGTLLLSDGNSINMLGGTLYLQNKGLGGIDLLAGKVTIDVDGNALFEGDLTIKGTLFAQTIEATGSAKFTGNIVALGTLDAGGGFTSSGSATISELNINRDGNLLTPGPDGVFETIASAGTGKLAIDTMEVTIRSPFVKEGSLVYLTPIGSTDNQVIYLKNLDAVDQTITVGIDKKAKAELQFNWWIVN
ncbi:hypothetical protein COS55_03255 [Candidatus Shapirobacteria bacterium CG03_land_8_20_14_0_80_40_19]|uniref:Peptidase S74 domain-containing protein n=2 Tax=Candidatus Shapironibacteriota TaxID=1752721 RepID=A0A2M7BC09_9BACT|nr:MAG: hypothetical protein COS55_03255 [Candidatus Shapirobacteria bacterium CG03_land_8_20_14_0_80_40_19]